MKPLGQKFVNDLMMTKNPIKMDGTTPRTLIFPNMSWLKTTADSRSEVRRSDTRGLGQSTLGVRREKGPGRYETGRSDTQVLHIACPDKRSTPLQRFVGRRRSPCHLGSIQGG